MIARHEVCDRERLRLFLRVAVTVCEDHANNRRPLIFAPMLLLAPVGEFLKLARRELAKLCA